jgi:hypothetical protein
MRMILFFLLAFTLTAYGQADREIQTSVVEVKNSPSNPSDPPAGSYKLFVQAGELKLINSDGEELEIGTGGGGGGTGIQQWLTGSGYDEDVVVLQSNKPYICLETHTSGTFATDLAAGKWQQIQVDGTAVINTPSGNLAAVTAQAALNELQGDIDTNTTAIATKQATITGAATTITSSNLTASKVLQANSSGKVAVISGISVSGNDITSTGIVTSSALVAENTFLEGYAQNNTPTGSGASVSAANPIVVLVNGSLVSINNIVPSNGASSVSTVTLMNETGNSITLTNNSGGTATSRIVTGTGADMILPAGSAVMLKYNSVATRWNVISPTVYPGPYRTVQTITTPGANTYIKPSGVKAVEFIYCGGGGAGGGAAATSATQASVGEGGEAGDIRGCILTSPASSISISIGTAGTAGAAGAAGNAGGDTTITGCTTAAGGIGGGVGAANTSNSAHWGDVQSAAITSLTDNRYGKRAGSNGMKFPSLNFAMGGEGGYALHPLLAFDNGGTVDTNTAGSGVASPTACSGGGGAANGNSQAARAGGAGGAGYVIALEYY